METKLWSEYEKEFLKENYPLYGIQYCSDRLNRTKRGIRKILKKCDIQTTGNKAVKDYYTKEHFEKVVKQSNSIAEVIRLLGLTSHNNRQTVQKYIQLYGIVTNHFESQAERNKRIVHSNKIELIDILVEGSTYKTSHLKERLYNDGLKDRCCELCGQGEIWNGKRMSLILDHINGVNNDNRLENLRIVCPNCNATLDTHCGKNKRVSTDTENKNGA